MSKKSASDSKSTKSGHQVIVQKDLFPIAEREVDGIGMGVLEDGTAYLNLRGLARLCGVDHAALSRLVNNWETEIKKPRGKKIFEILQDQNYFHDSIHFNVRSNNKDIFALPDSVCLAILEYYAFESAQGSRETALTNYRYLARVSFRTFIYNTCGYDPQQLIPEVWKTYHARVLLNDQLPRGYFSVFREIAEIVIHMIRGGCAIDSSTVPDISVGIAWAKHWKDEKMESKFGERKKFSHVYPDWFPQSSANPVPANVYPLESLGEFRKWLNDNYLTQKFPKYIKSKVKQGKIPATSAGLLIEVMNQKPDSIEDKTG